MTVEEMLSFLGVRTQSKESIDLCYKMDLEAFNMMENKNNRYDNERYIYKCVYENLLDELGYAKLDSISKANVINAINSISLEEDDYEYRNQYFTGLERTLLRYGRFDLVGFQRIQESDREGMAKDAYLYELRGDFESAYSYYEKIGEAERLEICKNKMI